MSKLACGHKAVAMMDTLGFCEECKDAHKILKEGICQCSHFESEHSTLGPCEAKSYDKGTKEGCECQTFTEALPH